MKNKVTISKSIALVLCVITMTITFNIYLSYKDLYVSDNLPRDSIIYIAAAKASQNNSDVFSNEAEISSIDKSEINNNREYQQKKIFINIFILFLSFISLASVHNYILSIETNKNHIPKKMLNTIALNKKADINSTFSLKSKEGVK